MKKKFKSLVCGLLLLQAFGCSTETPIQNWKISSFDGSLQVQAKLDEKGKIYYSVKKNDVFVVEESSLGIDVDVADFSSGLEFVSSRENSGVAEYNNITGKVSHVEDKYKDLILTFKDFDFYLDITFRLFDDGYAFNYQVRADDDTTGTMNVLNESTTFKIPSDSTCYLMPYVSSSTTGTSYYSYEEQYMKKKATEISSYQISMPMLYSVNKNTYSLITEAGLYGSEYYGSFLSSDKKGKLTTILPPASTDKTKFEVSYPFTSPWRVGITGSLEDIFESNMIESVYGDVETYKPDNYDNLSDDEKDIYNYDWVDPTPAAFSWYQFQNEGQNNWELQKVYVDLAYQMNWHWVIIDGGWIDNFDESKFDDFKRYCDERNVKIMAWGHATIDFGNSQKRLGTLKKWSRLGIKGVKIDFFDGHYDNSITERCESQDTIKLYDSIYKACADYKMVVNIHGCNKPTGERRIYPNVINREAVRGNEMANVNSNQTSALTLIRTVVGPTDFTPVVLSNDDVRKTQFMALCVLLESGMHSMAGKITVEGDRNDYLDDETIVDFYRDLPAAWDESKYIQGTPLNEVIVARRKNDNWYIVGSTVYDLDVSIALDFVDEGSYSAVIYTDDADDYNVVHKEIKDVTNTSTLNLKMNFDGGFVIKLIKKI